MTHLEPANCRCTFCFALLLGSFLLLSACAQRPPTAVIEDRSEEYAGTQDAARPVVSLLAKAKQHENLTQWERAAALLERALRIEPRNAYLWHRLANIRLQQGRYGMAESLAEKSNSLVTEDETLRQRNAELIETARRLARMSPEAG